MDILSISLATKKTLEKLGVKIVPDTVITFDGNFEGKEDYGDFIRVSEKAIDIHAVTSVKFHSEGGEPEIYGVEDFEYLDATIPGSGFILLGGGEPVVLSFGESTTLGDLSIPVGTYFLAEADFWLEELVIPGTIHPIDPKFIPGAVLPVVELTTVPTEEGAVLTDKESAAVQAAYDTRIPCVVKCVFPAGEELVANISLIMYPTELPYEGGSVNSLNAEVTSVLYSIKQSDGAWIFSARVY